MRAAAAPSLCLSVYFPGTATKIRLRQGYILLQGGGGRGLPKMNELFIELFLQEILFSTTHASTGIP